MLVAWGLDGLISSNIRHPNPWPVCCITRKTVFEALWLVKRQICLYVCLVWQEPPMLPWWRTIKCHAHSKGCNYMEDLQVVLPLLATHVMKCFLLMQLIWCQVRIDQPVQSVSLCICAICPSEVSGDPIRKLHGAVWIFNTYKGWSVLASSTFPETGTLTMWLVCLFSSRSSGGFSIFTLNSTQNNIFESFMVRSLPIRDFCTHGFELYSWILFRFAP